MLGWIALGGFAAWLAVTFGWHTWRLYRRTGDTGVRMAGGRSGVQRAAMLLFAVALLAGIAAPVAALLGFPTPTGPLALPVAGGIIVAATIVATPLTQAAMRDSWRIGVESDEHTALVTSGPFRLARNPMFTLSAAVSLGLALLVPNVIALLGVTATIAAVQLQVRGVEEPHLLAAHGRTYRDYAAVTGRFVPGLGRLTAPAPAGGRRSG
ncbi:methyltransferase family protein [Salinactinospora qingdaonensis]|uniref:methyltransferase family protein n=1 Tax=Salinactinospora qingdaonensis TaxID=702744 RepID=UPI0031EECC55